MPNPTQLSLLSSFFGAEGIYISTIFESTKINAGTKVLYLQRALDNGFFEYNEYISKLFLITFKEEQDAWVELVRAFKLVNDLYCNNIVKFDNYGLKPSLEHYFSSLGPIELSDFQQAIRQTITDQIEAFSENNKQEIAEQIEKRIADERTMGTGQWWHEYLDVPMEQKMAWFVAQPGFRELAPEIQLLIATEPYIARSVFQAIRLTMQQCQLLGVARFRYFMDNWYDLGLVLRVFHLNASQLIALSQELLEDFLTNHFAYHTVFSKGETSGKPVAFASFFALEASRRHLFCNDTWNSWFFLDIIEQSSMALIDFMQLDFERISTIAKHGFDCYLLIEKQLLFAPQLFQLSIEDLTSVLTHPDSAEANVIFAACKASSLHKKQRFAGEFFSPCNFSPVPKAPNPMEPHEYQWGFNGL